MVDYDKYAKTFAKSRKNMKWQEIDYFITQYINKPGKILDIGCGSARLYNTLFSSIGEKLVEYIGVDLSKGLLEEARKTYPKADFRQMNMLDIDILKGEFDYIFFIASFHHLNNTKDRIDCLEKIKKLAHNNTKIFFTNWALNSKLNKEKYKTSKIQKSENEFGGEDYDIKIGDSSRFYHCFSISELEYLFEKSGFEILENKLFDGDRNFVSVIKK